MFLSVSSTASWRSLPVSFVTRSLNLDTHWLPISGHTRRRNLSSVHTATMHQASKVNRDYLVKLLEHKHLYEPNMDRWIKKKHDNTRTCDNTKWTFRLELVNWYLLWFSASKQIWMFTWGSILERNSAASTVLSSASVQDISR